MPDSWVSVDIVEVVDHETDCVMLTIESRRRVLRAPDPWALSRRRCGGAGAIGGGLGQDPRTRRGQRQLGRRAPAVRGHPALPALPQRVSLRRRRRPSSGCAPRWATSGWCWWRSAPRARWRTCTSTRWTSWCATRPIARGGRGGAYRIHITAKPDTVRIRISKRLRLSQLGPGTGAAHCHPAGGAALAALPAGVRQRDLETGRMPPPANKTPRDEQARPWT